MLEFKKNKKGFTLIEILLVIVILGILASIAIPRFITSEYTAKEKACQIQISELRTQIEKYYFSASPPAYPASLAVLVANTDYFPNGGSTVCPINTATAYTYNATIGTVSCGVGHAH